MNSWIALMALALVGCSTSSPTPDQQTAPVEPSAAGELEPTLVLEPLIPNDELPAGSDLHYDFAHFVIPLIVFSSPRDKVREQFLGPTANRFLETQWSVLHEERPLAAPKAQTVELEVGDAALIEMPPPERNAHAYFMLIVFKTNGPIRYMTLERGVFMKEDDPHRTVIGEWSIEDGSARHSNFGEGPPPEQQPFLDAVIEYLR